MKKASLGEWDYATGDRKPMSCLASDLQIVVNRSIKIALALLLEGTEQAFLDKIVPEGCSMLFVGNEKDFFLFTEPFQEIWAETEIDPECTCQTLK